MLHKLILAEVGRTPLASVEFGPVLTECGHNPTHSVGSMQKGQMFLFNQSKSIEQQENQTKGFHDLGDVRKKKNKKIPASVPYKYSILKLDYITVIN